MPAAIGPLVLSSLMKASRSSFTWFLCVVHRPCEAPLYTLSTAPYVAFGTH